MQDSYSLAELISTIQAEVVFSDSSKSGDSVDLQKLRITDALPPTEAVRGNVTMIDSIGRISDVRATAVVTPKRAPEFSGVQLVSSQPHEVFAKLVAKFRPPLDWRRMPDGIAPTARIDASTWIHPTAVIGPGVVIGARCCVMPGACIMARTVIGNDCTIGPNTVLYEYTRIGDRVAIHAGSVLGAYGFGYRQVGGKHVPTSQLGYVVVEDDVEIGASSTIDRGTYGTTRIGAGTKIDNQVMIAHNCQIGKRNLICSQVGIAGSCCTGDDVILAGQVGLKDHIHLGNRTIVGAQAGVMEDLEGNQVYLGSPATSQREQMQIMAVERRLPEMRREIKTLRRDVDLILQKDTEKVVKKAA
jgi:UDP-3-O-[3-hydroxymyristoyl] glucosamine N-acyltransferase